MAGSEGGHERPRDMPKAAGQRLEVASKELPELPFSKSGVLDDAAHREGIDRIVAGNSQDGLAVGHDDVLALASHAEARLFDCCDGPEVVDTGNPGHGLHGYLDLADHHARGIVDCHLHVLADGIRNVR